MRRPPSNSNEWKQIETLATDSVINLHIYPSYLTNESRILKETHSIVANGLARQVVIVGFWKKGLPREEELQTGITVKRIDCLVGKMDKIKLLNGLPFLIFYVKCFFYGVRLKPSVINCHTLTLLPLCVAMKFAASDFLVYDPHELETETNESRGMRRSLARFIEKVLIRFADHIIVVSESIRTWYMSHYKLNPSKIDVIKNIPSIGRHKIVPEDLKSRLQIPSGETLCIYQGYLSNSRGVNDIITTFRQLPTGFHILFMGYGPLESEIKNQAASQSNIHHLPAASPEKVLNFTAGADIGVHIIPNTCLNHFYCLPNKVFEYALAGVPFIASNFPDIRNEFEARDVAWFVDPGAASLTDLISSISRTDIERKKSNCRRSGQIWNWGMQEGIYIRIYHAFGDKLGEPQGKTLQNL